MLAEQTGEPPLDRIVPVASRDELVDAIAAARDIFVEESVNRYVVALLRHTRGNQHLALGASPRSGIALLRLAKARALVERRDVRDPGRHPRDGRARALAPAPARPGGSLGGPRPGRRRPRGTRGNARTGVRRRSSGAIGLGLVALVASWAFGSTPLAVVGLGLAAAGIFARAVGARVPRGRSSSSAGCSPVSAIEGDDLAVEVRGAAPPAPARRRDRPPAAPRPARAGRADAALGARSSSSRPPARAPPTAPLDVVLTDPLGLERRRAAGRRGVEHPHSAADPGADVDLLDARCARRGSRPLAVAASDGLRDPRRPRVRARRAAAGRALAEHRPARAG